MMSCANCRMTIKGAKIVIKGRYWCAECVYYKERGEQNPKVSS